MNKIMPRAIIEWVAEVFVTLKIAEAFKNQNEKIPEHLISRLQGYLNSPQGEILDPEFKLEITKLVGSANR